MQFRIINSLPLAIVVTIALSLVGKFLLPDPPSSQATVDETQTRSASNVAQSQHMQLVPNSIYDGDTLRVTDGRKEMKIRLCGIDAPEKEQPMGVESRDHLRSLVAQGDGSIIVVPVERDRYGRTVAELFVKVQGKDEEIAVNAQMVRDGYAYHYARYSGDCPNGALLAGVEEEARSSRLGVWNDPNAMKPWDYRKSR